MNKLIYVGSVLTGALAIGSCDMPFEEETSHARHALFTSFFLDTYEPINDGAAGPIYGSDVLEAGHLYRVTVHGTFSVWNSWSRFCGDPEAAPIYPSPGRPDSYVGLDAEFHFAAPNNCSALPYSLPRELSAFELSVDGGASWSHLPAETSDVANHEYTYIVTGQGVALGARFRDYPTTDNYGKLKLTIEPLVLDEDGDGIPDNEDTCPDTTASDPAAGVPSIQLGVNRWADIDGDGVFDTVSPRGKGPDLAFTIEDTTGCNCTQIIESLALGAGHAKHGCSISALREWTSLVSESR